MRPTANASQHNRDAKCPYCGYDLRGHPDHAVCPECGRTVVVSAVHSEMGHWADLCLLDLWSISILQIVGGICLAISAYAISCGQYIAVVLILSSFVYMFGALLWLFFVFINVVARLRRHRRAALPVKRWRQVYRWSALNAIILGATIFAIILVRRL